MIILILNIEVGMIFLKVTLLIFKLWIAHIVCRIHSQCTHTFHQVWNIEADVPDHSGIV